MFIIFILQDSLLTYSLLSMPDLFYFAYKLQTNTYFY
nr:MAG TPA: hypothetical protein [Caudoviricetes sp.]DAZ38302.1 MAG TPA: hypothetical protein [Caudoviricetes sp.]